MFLPKLPAIVLAMIMCSFVGHAQVSQRREIEYAAPSKPLGNNALQLTREMTNRLHLSEAQVVKLLPVNRAMLANANGIARQFRYDEATRTQKLVELEARYERECSSILTPSQLSQLQQRKPEATPAASNGLG